MALGGDIDNPSVGGGAGGGAPTDATYITQTANGDLSAEQALGLLDSGILKNTTTTGVLSIATEGADYYKPGGTDVAVADGGTGASTASGARTNLGLAIGADVQAYDADLSTLATAFTTASATGAASLALHEDTDNGTNKVTLAAPSSISSDKTITLPDATDTLVGKATTDTLTNKTIDANGTGNSITNLEVADFASGVVDADLSAVSASDDTIPSAKATKAMGDLKLAKASNLSDLANASTARANLGVAIGADVQAYSANLDEYAGVNPTAAGLALLDDADASAQRTTLGLGALATLGTVGTSQIDNDAVTFAKIQNLTSDRLLGRDTTGTGDTEEITVGGGVEFTGSGGIQRSALTGNVTASAGSNSTTIAPGVITNAMLSATGGEPGGAWASWTPTLSGRFDNSKWNKTGRYLQIGKTIWFSLKLVANTTTPMSGGTSDARFTLPVTASGNYQGGDQNAVIGSGGIFDAGTSVFQAFPIIASDSATVGRIRHSASATGVLSAISSTAPMTWTTGDEITISGCYEAA